MKHISTAGMNILHFSFLTLEIKISTEKRTETIKHEIYFWRCISILKIDDKIFKS